jgi:hypothetical protein
MRNKGGQQVAVVSSEYGTFGNKGLFVFFNFAVVFSSMYFRFRQVQTNY